MANLIEATPYLSISSLKRDFLRCREREYNINGIIDIGFGRDKQGCNYWFDYEDDATFFVISINGNDPQKILVSAVELLFGTRSYFVCECGSQVNSLYLPEGKDQLKCRRCYHLVYELSTINRSSKHGRIFYMTNRTIKLVNRQERISRIFYKSRYTKRFKRFLKLSGQAGFGTTIESARKLMKEINEQ